MPDDDREWTLEKKKRNKIQQEKEQASKVLQCPECFFTFSPEVFDGNRKVCPHCGYMFPNKERSINVEEETKLIKVVGFKLDYSGPEQCQSYAELVEYAKQHGYKRGWAFYEARKRGLIVSDRTRRATSAGNTGS